MFPWTLESPSVAFYAFRVGEFLDSSQVPDPPTAQEIEEGVSCTRDPFNLKKYNLSPHGASSAVMIKALGKAVNVAVIQSSVSNTVMNKFILIRCSALYLESAYLSCVGPRTYGHETDTPRFIVTNFDLETR